MTQNQIAYASMQETQRSNLVREEETFRSNTERERETSRSNIAREEENIRSNMKSEDLGQKNLDERVRQYSDMAGYNKNLLSSQAAANTTASVLNVAKTAESVTKSVANIAQAAKDTRKSVSILGGL